MLRTRLRLRGKTLCLCALLVISPVLVAWLMGAYDAWTSWRYQQDLARAAGELAALVNAGADRQRVAATAQDHEVFARVIDHEGKVALASAPRFGDGRVSRSRWFAAVADFFHGPDGSPDLLVAERELAPPTERPELMAALAGKAASRRRSNSTGSAFVFYRAVPLDNGGAVYVARLSRRSARALYDHRYRLLKITLLLLVLAVAIAVNAGRSVVRPLARMRAQVVAHLDDGAVLKLGANRADEIGDLARAFEEFAARLRERATRAATASAELAHDLKSPISAVLASAELLEHGAGTRDPERQRRIAAGVRRAAEHLEQSVQGFMTLAALDELLLDAPRVPTDVGTVAQRVVSEVAAQAQHAEVQFACEVTPGAVALADPERVAQLVRNLVDNAADFAASSVVVTVTCSAEAVELVVADDGPGVTGSSRSRVFERFFSARGPERSGRMGRGLGLATVKTIAEAYRGTAELLAQHGLGGAAFRVSLPRI